MPKGGYSNLGRAHHHGGPGACPAVGCVPDAGTPDYESAAERMRDTCRAIYARALAFRLDTTPEKILRQYKWWLRWYEGRLATGYLMKQTGVERIESRKDQK